MKILLMRKYNPFYERGASSNRYCGLINGLRKSGNIVDIAIVGGFLKKKEKKSIESNEIYLSKADHYSYWSTRLNNYLFNKLYLSLTANRFRRIDYNSYDIIWITKDAEVLDIYYQFKDKIQAKVLIELNEFDDYFQNANYNFLQKRKALKAKAKFMRVVSYIDLFAVMTKTLTIYYQQMAKKNARFIHLPMTVDLQRFENVSSYTDVDGPYIAFCGSIDKAKDGVDVLIKSFIKIAYKHPDVKLILAGFYTYDTPEILNIVSDSDIRNRIKYIGSLDRTEVPAFLNSASILALSRPNSHQAQGGFPTKLGEYLATGKPVCVTRVGEIPDYLIDGESAFFADPGDVDSFADALDRALSDLTHAQMVGSNGKLVAQSIFNADIQAQRLSEFLHTSI